MKYLWTYVDARGKWYIRAKSYYSFGTTLHKVLERFHDSGDLGVTTVGDALRAYEESWIDAGYSSPEEMQEAFGEGREILEDKIGTELNKLSQTPGLKTIAVEKLLKWDLGPFVLIGRVDRIAEYPDGTREIVDYKSGKHTFTEQDVKDHIAMSCYQLLHRRNYPETPVVATIDSLGGNSVSASLNDHELEQFESDVIRIGTEILSTTIDDHVPSLKNLCRTCDFLRLCSQYPGFEIPDQEFS